MMYGPALFFMLILGLAATASVAGIAGAARSAVSIATNRALETGVRHAAALYQYAIANQIQTDPHYGDPTNTIALLDNPKLLTVATSTETIAPLTLSETVTPTTATAPSCGADAGGADLATDVQCSHFIQESRASLRIDVQALANDGVTVLGAKSVIVTMRLFAVPPFAEIAGMKDLTQVNPTNSNPTADATAPKEDDSAGRNGAVIAPDRSLGSVDSGPGDTAIHVQYQCTGANCSQPHPPNPDALTDRHWTNGNTTTTGGP